MNHDFIDISSGVVLIVVGIVLACWAAENGPSEKDENGTDNYFLKLGSIFAVAFCFYLASRLFGA